MEIRKSAKLYMERKLPAYQNTLRGPVPQLYLHDNPVHRITLKSPFPLPKFSYNRKYVDGGKIGPWPTGECAECSQ